MYQVRYPLWMQTLLTCWLGGVANIYQLSEHIVMDPKSLQFPC